MIERKKCECEKKCCCQDDNEGNEYISDAKTRLKMTLETEKNFQNNTFENSKIKSKFA